MEERWIFSGYLWMTELWIGLYFVLFYSFSFLKYSIINVNYFGNKANKIIIISMDWNWSRNREPGKHMKLRLIRVGLILPIPVIKRLSSYDVCFPFCMCSIFLFLKSGFFFFFCILYVFSYFITFFFFMAVPSLLLYMLQHLCNFGLPCIVLNSTSWPYSFTCHSELHDSFHVSSIWIPGSEKSV